MAQASSSTTTDASAPSLPRNVIEPLCRPFSRQADHLLDLYEMTRLPARHPGRCLRCFYDLFQAASPEKRKALDPLRQWIEDNLEIAVSADRGRPATLPIRLEEPDLESFCQGAMSRVREERLTDAERVSLEIRFKAAA
jgi:hypothetical protein